MAITLSMIKRRPMEDGNLTVRKSNTLIDSRHQLNTHQQRVFMLFVSKIKKNDKPDKTYKLKWSDLREISHGKIDTRAKITELFESMRSKRVNLSSGNVDRAAGYFSFYENDPVKQVVNVRVDPAIQQELFDLIGKFTLLNLVCALNLDSPYHIRLYEILKARLFKDSPEEIDLKKLKWSLDCDGVKTYDSWANFKRYVLDKAQTAMASHTDIKFTYKTVTTGRKVTSIKFTIEENEKWQSTITGYLKKEEKKKAETKVKPPRNFIKPGDVILIGGVEREVGPSVCEHGGKSFPIGQLTEMLKGGKISIVKESN
jgi:plasmid replication initiation protein